MKKELNMAISDIENVREEDLFREMARQFSKNTLSKCTYVKEVHKMMVDFYSNIKGGVQQKEIGDLLLLTYNKLRKELRLCILQAKYRRGSYRKFLNCKADIFQWELLYYKPDVYNKSTINIPKHILNFRHDYKSITAYGVFYHDKKLDMIDFLYTLPELFTPRHLWPSPSNTFAFNCPNLSICKSSCCGCSTTICPTKQGGVPKETLYTCSMDIFEHEILSCRIGAPINSDEIQKYVLGLLVSMKKTSENPEVIDEILRDYDYRIDSNDDFSDYEHPSAIIVITESDYVSL